MAGMARRRHRWQRRGRRRGVERASLCCTVGCPNPLVMGKLWTLLLTMNAMNTAHMTKEIMHVFSAPYLGTSAAVVQYGLQRGYPILLVLKLVQGLLLVALQRSSNKRGRNEK